MPQCEVTVAVGKRAKVVVVEFAKGLEYGEETLGDYCASRAMILEPNAEKVLFVGGLTATKAEIAAAEKAAKRVRKTESADDVSGTSDDPALSDAGSEA